QRDVAQDGRQARARNRPAQARRPRRYLRPQVAQPDPQRCWKGNRENVMTQVMPPPLPGALPRVESPAAAVAVDGVTKRYPGGLVALDNISLNVAPSEFVCLVGASGCGKSTLLNLIAGLDSPTTGTVTVAGRATLLFQEAALLPWLTAAGNVELALRLRGT